MSRAISSTFARVYSENAPPQTTVTTDTKMATVSSEVSANEKAIRDPYVVAGRTSARGVFQLARDEPSSFLCFWPMTN